MANQQIQRGVHRVRQRGLPLRRRRVDRRPRAAHPRHQAQQRQREHRQAKHEVPHLHRVALGRALRKDAAQFDGGKDGDQQQQHEPVQADRQGRIFVDAVLHAGLLEMNECGQQYNSLVVELTVLTGAHRRAVIDELVKRDIAQAQKFFTYD
jgi:hypothetical protein